MLLGVRIIQKEKENKSIGVHRRCPKQGKEFWMLTTTATHPLELLANVSKGTKEMTIVCTNTTCIKKKKKKRWEKNGEKERKITTPCSRGDKCFDKSCSFSCDLNSFGTVTRCCSCRFTRHAAGNNDVTSMTSHASIGWKTFIKLHYTPVGKTILVHTHRNAAEPVQELRCNNAPPPRPR